MDENMNNQPQENDPSNKGNPKESIPLWLQGLSERNAENQKSVPDEWRKEEEFLDNGDEASEIEGSGISEEGPVEEVTEFVGEDEPAEEVTESKDEEERAEEILDVVNEEEPEQDDLPGWLDELADADPDAVEFSEQKTEPAADWNEDLTEEEDEITEEIEISSVEDVGDIEYSLESQSPEQGDYLDEIRSLELDESAEDEVIPEDEEIPEWLREMIAAEERHSMPGSQSSVDERVDEPTQPVILEKDQDYPKDYDSDESGIVKAADQEIEIYETTPPGKFQLIEDMFEIESKEDEEIVESASPELQPLEEAEVSEDQYELHIEDIEAVLKDDQPEDLGEGRPDPVSEFEESQDAQEAPAPPSDSIESHPADQDQEDHSGYEGLTNDPGPNSLISAKALLKEGDLDGALKIISGSSIEPDQLDQVKEWLYSAIENSDCDKSKLWEALGDMAIQQGNHAEAFESYTKAIKNLDKFKVEQNEFD